MSRSFWTALESAWGKGKRDYRYGVVLRVLRWHGIEAGDGGHARDAIPDFTLTAAFVKDLVDELIYAHGRHTGPG